MPDPLLVPCEGSGCPPAYRCMVTSSGMCSMCGIVHDLVGKVVVDHERLDIMAMVERGDFDE